MSAYYINPPHRSMVYIFLWKHKLAQHMEALVEWADKEYFYALQQAAQHKRWGTHRTLTSEWSGFRVLSQMEGFRKLCANLDDEQWNKLKPRTRKFIRKAYEMYELLRD